MVEMDNCTMNKNPEYIKGSRQPLFPLGKSVQLIQVKIVLGQGPVIMPLLLTLLIPQCWQVSFCASYYTKM